VGGLDLSVGYAEDKEIETPNAAAFPVPWDGSPNTTFLGNSVPGQTACGTLPACYDTGALRLDNPGSSPVTVTSVSVDDHSSITGGKVFDNLWGSFTVAPGKSVILAANPPADDPGYDNFDTSGFPSVCTPITVAPTVTVTIGGTATTLVDSTHVLDTGGIDAGTCPPKINESIQWRPIGSAGADTASLSLGPPTMTAVAGKPATVTATLLDGSGAGLANAVVDFAVTGGPDAGTTGTAVTNANGQAAFSYSGNQGEDTVSASVTTVGTFTAAPVRVLWTDGSLSGWTGTDVGGATPSGSQSVSGSSGAWTVAGGGAGLSGTSDQFHLVSQPVAAGVGVGAEVTALSGGSGARAGVVERASGAANAAGYAALVTPSGGVVVQERATTGGPTTTVATLAGTLPQAVWVSDSGGALTTYTSSDGITFSPLSGSTVNLSLGSGPVAGVAVTSGSSSSLSTATQGYVVLSGTPPAAAPPVACPAPWSCADIGSPAPAGTQSYAPGTGTWTISAGGTDITGASDQFHYVWQSQTGNGSVSAQVATQSDSSSNAKAGVMLRVSTDPAAPNYAVLVSPGAGIKVQVRSVDGGTTTKLANPTGTTPAYLEVTRSGNTFTASTSPDGLTWTTIPGSSYTMTLPSTLLAGMAVTSHHSGVTGTVTMDAVSAS
jgi:hypothetical protein